MKCLILIIAQCNEKIFIPLDFSHNRTLRRRGGNSRGKLGKPLFFFKITPLIPLFEEEGEIIGENWGSPSFSKRGLGWFKIGKRGLGWFKIGKRGFGVI
jgi:hypothetical protein